ncbi:MAG TPA: protease pro-enzyme activation domain-containing protein [Trebonia sp.]|nr:protease pro-enzyme activation domain-containing protein [Trebonia sp.]
MKRSVIAAAALAATITAAAAGAAAQADAVGVPVGQVGPVGHVGPAGRVGAGTARLPDSVAPFATASRATGTVPAADMLTLQFWLTPRVAAAESYATAVSTPGNPLFRQFLSPSAYTARFAATHESAVAVESWLTSEGFARVTTDSGRDYVRATAPVSAIDKALKIQLNYYRAARDANAGRYPLRANDRPVSLPASIVGLVAGVTGLDNAAPTMTYARAGDPRAPKGAKGTEVSFACSQWYLQHYAAGLPRQYGTTKFPTVICGYTPQQLRRAYGYSAANDGKGVTIALVEVGTTPDMFATLQTYAKVHDLQAPSAGRYAELSLGEGAACGDPFNIEEQLDVESSYDLAPMASQLVVGGDSCDNGDYGLQALYDADASILDGAGGHPLATIASNSWEGGDETIPVNLLWIEHDYLVKAAAEGVTMLFSAGDSSGVAIPSSDPYATAVGATTLGIGRGNPRLFETGWSTGISAASDGRWEPQGEQGAAGGGPSLLWKQPAYQHGAVPDRLAVAPGDRGGLVRAIPDISAVGDPFTGMATGMLSFNAQGDVIGYFEESIGGTSLAAPLVAAVVADAEQGSRAFGFLNPALYLLAKTRPGVFHDAQALSGSTPAKYRGVACDQDTCGVLALTTFDDQSWSMTGYTGQVTAPGYDTMTGLGTPNGQQLISALRAL